MELLPEIRSATTGDASVMVQVKNSPGRMKKFV